MRNSGQELLTATRNILRQGIDLLSTLTDEQYTCRFPAAFNASIGGHYRHCLDHFQILLSAQATDGVNYDHRERDQTVENDRFAALQRTRQLLAQLEPLDTSKLDRTLVVTGKIGYGETETPSALSTWGREFMYGVSHAIHHFALIAILANLQGIRLPDGFGIAPSTLKHREQLATCASA